MRNCHEYCAGTAPSRSNFKAFILLLALTAGSFSCLEPTTEDGGGGELGGGTGSTGGGGQSVGGGSGGGAAGGGGGGIVGGGGGQTGGSGGGTTGDGGTQPDAGTGASCASASLITPVAQADGGLVVTFAVLPIADTVHATCLLNGGLDAVFQYELTQAQDVTLRAASDAGITAAFFIRQSPCISGTLMGCARREVPRNTAVDVVRFFDQSPGTYFLFVEMESGSQVDVTMSLSDPLPPVVNDSCASPQPLAFLNGGARVFAHTAGATSSGMDGDQSPTCGYPFTLGQAQDVVYSYVLTTAQDVTIETTPFAGFRPFTFVRRVCDDPEGINEVACMGGNLSIPVDRKTLLNQQPGTYYVWVQGLGDGAFELALQLRPPTLPSSNDLCSSPLPLFPDGGLTSTLIGNNYGSFDNYGFACLPPAFMVPEAETVYAFSISQPQELLVTASSADVDGGVVQPSLMVMPRGGCLSDGGLSSSALASTTGCMASLRSVPFAPTNLRIPELATGDYLLFAETYVHPGSRQREGNFVLNAALSPVQALQPTSCSSPVSITLDSTGHGEVFGTTRDAGNRHSGSTCSAARSAAANDFVYRITTPAATGGDGGINMLLDIFSENSSELAPSVFVRSQCAPDAGAQLACTTEIGPSEPGNFALAVGLAPNSDYFVWVDGAAAQRSQGPFRLRVDTSTGPPPNDICATALPIPLNTSISGSLLGATGDYSVDNLFAGGPCTAGFRGPDVVYAFTPAASGNYTVELLPQERMSIEVAIVEACLPASRCLGATPGYGRSLQRVPFYAQANVTYYVVVDGQSESFGGNLPSGVSAGGFVVGIKN